MIQKIKYSIIFPILLVVSCIASAQSNKDALQFWKLNTVSGEAMVNGHYRQEERSGPGIYEYRKSSYLSGGLLLKTSSSILHPNFLTLDIEAGYVPETSRDNYLVIPDQSEVRTLKRLGGVTASFFKQKDITLNIFGNYDQSYSSRENLTSIKSTDKHLGGAFGYNNRFLPFTIEFHNKKWEEEEIQTGRIYKLDQKLLDVRSSKSFTNHDKNEFRYSHDENVSINQNFFRVANVLDNLELISYVSLDPKRKYNLTSMISDYIQYGNLDMKRFQASESVNFQLPVNLSFSGNYHYYIIDQNTFSLKQHGLNTSLDHMLFKSLRSRINYDYNSINHTVYKEFNTKSGFEFNYNKIIPGGKILINYRFDRYHQDYSSDPVALSISNEPYVLSDSKIILLKSPYTNINSVVVKDFTGTLFYIIGLDYILIQREKYIEIRRIPGGSIPDNGNIYIDYTATQPGKYKYDANSHMLTSDLYLLNDILSFYYRFSTQDYVNLDKTEFVTLNYFTQNVAGCRLDFTFISAGAEYEQYKSSILPYNRTRYYVNFQKNLGKKVMLMLNGNLQDYTMLNETESKYQKYMDVTGKMIYSFIRQTQLNVDIMYRKQTGRGIDLDLLTAKSEITSTINRLYLTLGVELYRRNYVGETINFKGTYIKLVRKF